VKSFLFVFALVGMLAPAACTPQTPAPTPLAMPAGVSPTALQTLGYVEDSVILAQTAYLAYLNSPGATVGVVNKVGPVYSAAMAALASYRGQVLNGSATGTEPSALVEALTALNAALAASGIKVGA
jgi:hypothetical protein